MTVADDYSYRRAETELERAQQAVHPAAVRAHYVLAGHYLDRAYNAGDGANGIQSGNGLVDGTLP